MNGNEQFDRHYKRLVAEGILKSATVGISVCFSINLIFAFLYWMLDIGSIFIGIGISALVGALAGAAIYLFKYRPTEKETARRIDRLGLEERMITMLELKDNESCIAELQRKDAEKSLMNLKKKSIGYSVSRTSVAISASAFAVSICMTVVAMLAGFGILPHGNELFGGDDGRYEVIYAANEGGSLRGEKNQSVEGGSSTEAVLAVADSGWVFVRWDDGALSPERYEENVSSDMIITAIFERVDKGDGDFSEEDAADDLPLGSSNSSSGSGNSDQEGGDNPDQGEEGQGGGKWQDKNQFIDGATYYRDYLELYYKYAMSFFESNTEIPPEILEFFETYFSGI